MHLFEQVLSARETLRCKSADFISPQSHKMTIFRTDGQNCEVGNIQISIRVGKSTYFACLNPKQKDENMSNISGSIRAVEI